MRAKAVSDRSLRSNYACALKKSANPLLQEPQPADHRCQFSVKHGDSLDLSYLRYELRAITFEVSMQKVSHTLQFCPKK